MNQVEKATANPDHDFSKFGTGNKETLDILPKVCTLTLRSLLSHLFFPFLWSSSGFSGCGSGIPDPDFYPSRIPDLGSRIQKQ
jgi:hypothetical protein